MVHQSCSTNLLHSDACNRSSGDHSSDACRVFMLHMQHMHPTPTAVIALTAPTTPSTPTTPTISTASTAYYFRFLPMAKHSPNIKQTMIHQSSSANPSQLLVHMEATTVSPLMFWFQFLDPRFSLEFVTRRVLQVIYFHNVSLAPPYRNTREPCEGLS